VRAGWCIVAARRPDVFGDPFSYLRHAEDIAAGRGYATWIYAKPTAYFPVGYPAVLGGVLWLMGRVASSATAFQAVLVVNMAAAAATIVLTYAVAERVADRRVARLAAGLVAIFPGLVLYGAVAYVETSFTALVLLLAWLAFCGRDLVPARRRLVMLGLALGATALVRPIVLPFALVFLVVWRREGWRRSLGATAMVVLVAALVIVPWSIRSTRAMHGLVLVATNTGDDLCTGNSSFANGEYLDLGTHCWLGFDDVAPERLEVERDSTNTRAALSYALHHPAREVALAVRKAWFLMAHDHEGRLAADSYGLQPEVPGRLVTAVDAGADVWWWLTLVAATIGGVVSWRRGRPVVRGLVGIVAVLLGTPLVLFGSARFHVPAEPILAIFAAVALVAVADRRRRGQQGPVADAAATVDA
jgi:4-amino-4-deoxy-L-arabinose transferase-like glycosyltransferase